MKASGSEDELKMFGWEGLREFHEELTDMAENARFHDVIDSTKMTPNQVADHLAAWLP